MSEDEEYDGGEADGQGSTTFSSLKLHASPFWQRSSGAAAAHRKYECVIPLAGFASDAMHSGSKEFCFQSMKRYKQNFMLLLHSLILKFCHHHCCATSALPIRNYIQAQTRNSETC